MRRLLFSFLVLIPLMGFAVSGVAANFLLQADQTEFTLGEFNPQTPYPGQEVIVSLTGAADQAAGSVVQYEVIYENSAEGIKDQAKCSGECSLTLSSSEPNDLKFYAPAKEGTYTLTITVTGPAGGAPQALAPRTLVVETALPPSVAQLFAGLGLFAAVMAIMALGTEVVIEFGKLFLGLKAKVSAMEALDQLKAELPGQLNQLGVDEQTIRKYVDTTFEGLQKTLRPVADWANVQTMIEKGQYAQAFEAVLKMQPLSSAGSAAQDTLNKLKPVAVNSMKDLVDRLSKKIPLPAGQVTKLKDNIADAINDISVASSTEALRKVLEKTQSGLLETELEWSLNWLQSQAINLTQYGKDYVLNLAEKDIFKTLNDLGFADELVQDLRKELSQKIEIAGNFVETNTNQYVTAVKALLKGVEDQRNDRQSPARKIWRRLRKSEMPLIILSALVGLVQAFLWLVRQPILRPLNDWMTAWSLSGEASRWWGAVLILIATTIALWLILLALQLLIPILTAVFTPPKQASPTVGVLSGWKNLGSIPPAIGRAVQEAVSHKGFDTVGYFLRFVVERAFNYIRGVDSSLDGAEHYGEVHEDVTQQIEGLNPTNLAQVLMQREEKHQNEETNRVRFIRFISLLVGTYLAYTLRIDAAVYLNYAVPGIATQINAVNLDLGRLTTLFPSGLTVGMILTGLAASAGSKFWRDLLGRLQSSREQAENAARLVNTVKQMIPDGTPRV